MGKIFLISLLILTGLSNLLIGQVKSVKFFDNQFYKNRSFHNFYHQSESKYTSFIENGINHNGLEPPNNSGDYSVYLKERKNFTSFPGGFLNNLWFFDPPGFIPGRILSVFLSSLDTMMMIKPVIYSTIDPVYYTAITYNRGDTSIIIPNTDDLIPNICGIDILSDNDSIIYIAIIKHSPPVTVIQKSTDRGVTWQQINTLPFFLRLIHTDEGFLKINEFNKSQIFSAGENHTVISTNGGLDFFNLNIPPLNKIYFDYQDSLILGFSGSKLYVSENDVLSWDSITLPFVARSLFIDQTQPGVLYAGSDNGLYKSENGGNNWEIYSNVFFPSSKVIGITKEDTNSDSLIVVTEDAAYFVYEDSQNFLSYFPLQVGNKWRYKVFIPWGGITNYVEMKIERDTIINGHQYFYVNSQGDFLLPNGYLRFDENTGALIKLADQGNPCYSEFDLMIDSLAAKQGDSLSLCGFQSIRTLYCYEEFNDTIFSSIVKTKHLNSSFSAGISILLERYYSKNFGITRMFMDHHPTDATYYTLESCLINGQLYGDTLYQIAGRVLIHETGFLANDGYVKAIKFDKSNQNIITIDSTQIQPNGNFLLPSVPKDSLYIVAYPNSEIEADFVPTYHPSTLHWINASRYYFTSNSNLPDLRAFKMTRQIGNNTVSGNVYILNQDQNEPLEDAIVYLKNDILFSGFSVTDTSGYFKIDSVINGNYRLIVDRLGFSSDTITFNITEGPQYHYNFFLTQLLVRIENISEHLPSSFLLHQNYPNPFNPVTKIRFEIPVSEHVNLKVYDMLGREVAFLVNQTLHAGVYEYSFDASGLGSGVYFYRLQTGSYVDTKRMVVLK